MSEAKQARNSMDSKISGPPSRPTKVVHVVGSLNFDIIRDVASHQRKHTHRQNSEWGRRAGGHGANQAVAVYRASHDSAEDSSDADKISTALAHGLDFEIKVHMIGKYGDDKDERGKDIRDELERAGINVEGVRRAEGTKTGYAHISIDRDGVPIVDSEPGANETLDWKTVQELLYQKPPANLILVQLEIPIATAFATIQYANDNKIPIIFNPAPPQDGLKPMDDHKGIFKVDHLILNRDCADYIKYKSPLDEANFKTEPLEDVNKRYMQLCSKFHKDGANCVVITLGYRGVVASYLEPPDTNGTRNRRTWYSGAKVGPNGVKDETGASDAFIGAYAVEILRQLDEFEGDGSKVLDIGAAIYMGVKAGGLAVGIKSSMDSIPWRSQLIGKEEIFSAAEAFQFD